MHKKFNVTRRVTMKLKIIELLFLFLYFNFLQNLINNLKKQTMNTKIHQNNFYIVK